MLETPLVNVEKSYNANLGSFAGWITPLDFGDPLSECRDVRNSVGVFDISHMGRILIKGSRAYEFLQKLVTRDLSKLRPGEMGGPALILNEFGGIKDDVMIYKLSDYEWLMVCNAVNREKDINWMLSMRDKLGFSSSDVVFEDLTTTSVLIAVQGPKSRDVLESLGVEGLKDLKLLNFITNVKIGTAKAFLLSRSGWTGEEVRSYGFEIWTDIPNGIEVYRTLIGSGVRPCGLVARDILRIEMGYVLYGNDINEDVNPIEARYWIALTRGKDDCIGCDKVWEAYGGGVSKFRVGFKLKKGIKSIPRYGYKILAGEEVVGEVTSGAYSPTIDRAIGMGYIKASHTYLGFNLELVVRGKKYEVKISDFPLI
jgi:aminomethyltransferase